MLIKKKPVVQDPHLTAVIERLGESQEFWQLIRKYAALTLDGSTVNLEYEPVISGVELLAGLQMEMEHASEVENEHSKEWEQA